VNTCSTFTRSCVPPLLLNLKSSHTMTILYMFFTSFSFTLESSRYYQCPRLDSLTPLAGVSHVITASFPPFHHLYAVARFRLRSPFFRPPYGRRRRGERYFFQTLHTALFTPPPLLWPPTSIKAQPLRFSSCGVTSFIRNSLELLFSAQLRPPPPAPTDEDPLCNLPPKSCENLTSCLRHAASY